MEIKFCFQLSILNCKLGRDILPSENLCYFWILLPYRRSCLLSPASKHQNRITSSKSKPTGQSSHISWCNVSAYKWMGSHLRFFLVPISIHGSWRSKLKKWHKTHTTTSVSIVTISNCLNPLFEASRACKSKRVSASSWLQGWGCIQVSIQVVWENFFQMGCHDLNYI